MRVFKKQFIMVNKDFIDWGCEIRQILYGRDTDIRTIADCRPKVIRKPIETPIVGKPKPQ